MEIDIISYTAEQFAELGDEQILEVQQAQLKKNRLKQRLEKDKQDEKNRLIENGTYFSQLWDLYCARLQDEYEQEVSAIRDALLFYLQYSSRVNTDTLYDANYALAMYDRLLVVKSYYERHYEDPNARFEAFKKDKVAVVYLGEFYSSLYDYFQEARVG